MAGLQAIRHGAAGRRHKAAGCRHRAAGCGHRAAGCGHRAAGCRHGDAGCRHGAAGCRHGAASCRHGVAGRTALCCLRTKRSGESTSMPTNRWSNSRTVDRPRVCIAQPHSAVPGGRGLEAWGGGLGAAACAPSSSRPQWHSFAAYFERPPRVILVEFSGGGVGRRSHTGVRASSDDWCA